MAAAAAALPGRPAQALSDERLRILGRRWCIGRARRDPALGVFKRWRRQLQLAGPAGRGPLTRGFAVFRMFSDPNDVGGKSLAEPVGVRLKFCRVFKKHEVEAPQRVRDCLIGASRSRKCTSK